MLVAFYQMKAQEIILPLSENSSITHNANSKIKHKKNRATLPFIEDFSYEGPYPDANIWLDKQAYINNTMCQNPINRGVATLDGLNEFGRPYFKDQMASGLADSLTSIPFNFSTYTPSDNIYFSFYYQPQGLGFAPETDDSLFLYFKNLNNQWVRVWETRGTPLQAFKIVILPITDNQYLHNNFQFRFVNIASLNTNDDIWNIDYIKIDKNRSLADSIMNDIGFTQEPTSILENYTAMPYRQFKANMAQELSSNQLIEVGNYYNVNQNVSIHHEATEIISGTPISNFSLAPFNISAKSTLFQSIPSFTINYNSPNLYNPVIIQNKYYFDAHPGDRTQNDTIIRNTVFDNYFAYDDGSAEKSYFLLSAPNFPAKTALEFTLNQADSVRGLMIHFGAQAPTAYGKYFSIVLYKKLHAANQNDEIIYQQDLYQVMYEPSQNGFTTYAFDTAKYLEPGKYYIGITQPANFGSDSIYYGLDVNNNTNIQKLYYNVDGDWYASGAQGSVMMRPVVGLPFTASSTQDISSPNIETPIIYPNPTNDNIFIRSDNNWTKASIYDLQGRIVKQSLIIHQTITCDDLTTGTYILRLEDNQKNIAHLKLIKQ